MEINQNEDIQTNDASSTEPIDGELSSEQLEGISGGTKGWE